MATNATSLPHTDRPPKTSLPITERMSSSIAILSGSFHTEHMPVMVAAAQRAATELGLTVARTTYVPGSMEKPLALHWLLQQPEIAGVVVLGIIERGETAHGMVMGQAVIRSIMELQQQHNKPVGVGIIGPEVFPSQIAPRLVGYAEAAVRALAHMLALQAELKR
jgi:6,7-dimethyl-8-ribityllumazine synthase